MFSQLGTGGARRTGTEARSRDGNGLTPSDQPDRPPARALAAGLTASLVVVLYPLHPSGPAPNVA